MTMLFMDGFDHYAPAYFASRGWAYSVSPSISTSYPRTTPGGALNIWQQNQAISRPVSGSPKTLVLGAAIAIYGATVSTNKSFIRFKEGGSAGATHVSIGFDQYKNLVAWQGDAVTQIANTDVVFKVGGSPVPYYYVDVEVTIGDTDGAIKIWVDDVLRVNLTGLDTRNGGTNGVIDTLHIGLPSVAGFDILIDDLYCLDKTGTLNNARIGTCSIHTLFPNADASLGWLGSTGALHYALIDEQSANGDGDYVYASGPATDLFEFPDHPVARDVNIRAIQSVAIARKDDAIGRILRMVTRPLVTSYQGTSILLNGTSYTSSAAMTIQETNPETGLPWTKSEFNAAGFGFAHT